MMSAHTPRKRLSTEDRQDEIVRVAVELAADKGVDAVTTQDMADAMKVTQGAIFRHFASKNDIWLAVIVWVRERLMAVWDKAAAGGTDPLASIACMFRAHIAFIDQHPAVPRLLFSELLHKRNNAFQQLITGIIEGYETRISGLLVQAKEQGLVRPNLDCDSAAVLYIGMIQGLVLRSGVLGDKNTLQNTAQSTFDLYLAAVRHTPSEPGPLPITIKGQR